MLASRLRTRLAAGALLCLSFLLVGPAAAQSVDDLPPVTDTYALTGARVVQAPGQAIDGATVLVRDGLIEAVGRDVEVPYDARRIEADTLVVYAGFIDGLSHAGVDMPEDDDEGEGGGFAGGGDGVDPGDPPLDRSGIQPDRSVQSFLSPEASSLADLRKAGFTAGHVVPKGRMLPGAGAYVQYGGETVSDMMLEPGQTLFGQIRTAEGYVYPATDMAVIATMRQLFREAARRQELEAAYADDPSGRQRPPQDPSHSALFPVLDGTVPLAMYADDALSIHRAVGLQEELDVPFVLAGLAEAHHTLETLETTDAPFFLTLDLPEKPEVADTTLADTTDRPSRFYDSDLRTADFRDVEEEEENLELRHAAERKKYLQTAATLHEAGVAFGFTTRNVDAGDVHANLRTMIDEGLPEEAALAALTTRPASLLGLENRLGTVEAGKIANLVVTDGPLFDEDTSVQHVFVDGRLYDYSDDDPDEADGDEGSADPNG